MWAWIATVVIVTLTLYYIIVWLTSKHDRHIDGMFDWTE